MASVEGRVLLSGPQPPFMDSYVPLKGTSRSEQVPGDRDDQEALAILAALEQKRQQLEAQIAEFVQQKQGEYRRFERELLGDKYQKGPADRGTSSASTSTSGQKTAPHSEEARSTPLSDPKHDSGVDFGDTGQDGALSTENDNAESDSVTPVREHDAALAGVLLPAFLPLLDSKPIARPSSAMSAPAPAIEEPQTPTMRNRQASAPPALQSQLGLNTSKPKRRKSSMRTSSIDSTQRRSRKSVSLLVDDCVVRPAEGTPDEEAVLSPDGSTTSQRSAFAVLPPTAPPTLRQTSGRSRKDLSKASKKLRSPPPESGDPISSLRSSFPDISSKFKADSPPTPTALQSPVEPESSQAPAQIPKQQKLDTLSPDRPLSPLDHSPTASTPAISIGSRSPGPNGNGNGKSHSPSPSKRMLSNSYHRPDLTPVAEAIASQPELPTSSYVGSLEGEARGASWMEVNALALAAAREDQQKDAQKKKENLEKFEREVAAPSSRSGSRKTARTPRREEEEVIMGSMEGI